MSNDIELFVRKVFETNDCLVEGDEGGAIEVLLSETLAERFGGEMVRLHFRPEDAEEESALVGPDSEMLDNIRGIARERGAAACYTLKQQYLKQSGIDRQVASSLQFANAKIDNVQTSETTCPYTIFNFHYAAESAESKQGLVSSVLNEVTGASVPGLLSEIEGSPLEIEESIPSAPPPTLPWDKLCGKARELARQQVESETAELRDRMNRYLNRDFQEAVSGAASPEEGDTPDIDAIRESLKKQYAMRVSVSTVNGCRVFVPVVRCTLDLVRRSDHVSVPAYWNSVTKAVEPRACDSCLCDSFTFVLCDRMHLVCPDCHSTCEQCGRKVCRKCSPKGCPNCET